MTKKIFFSFIVIVVSLALFVPCEAIEKGAQAKANSPLIVLPGATAVQASKYETQDQVIYHLRADFPATVSIEEIKTKMANQGWQPLKEDFLNPGIPSAIIRGWSEFADATKKPKLTVHQWITDWSNSKGEIVRYVLRYEYPEGKAKDLTNLKVVALHLSAATVKEARKSVSGAIPKNKK